MRNKTIFCIFLLILYQLIPLIYAEENGVREIDRLVVGTTDQISDTNIMDKGFNNYRWELMDCGLVKFDSDGEIIPALATSWETDELKKWKFHLRDNALWHDGVPVTSEDIKFTIEYMKKKGPAAGAVYGDIQSVEIPDNRTVVIDLKNPDYNFLTTIGVLQPLPEHIFSKVDDPAKFNDKMAAIGCGPFVFESFDSASGVLTCKAFDKFWNGKPAINTIEFKIFKNPDTMILALEKGEVDAIYTYGMGIAYYYVPQLLKKDDIKILQKKDASITNVLWINTAKEPYNNAKLRQALSYAIDYEELKNLFTAGYGTIPDAGFVTDATLYYKETRKLSYDVSRSKSMLEDAGFKDMDGDGIREAPNGTKFEPELMVKSSNPEHVRAAEMVKKYFSNVGINAMIRPVDKNTFGDTMDVRKTFDMALSGTTVWGMNMGVGYGAGYIDTRYYGWSMVSDSKYQSIVDQLKLTQDTDKREDLAAEIQDYYAEELPQIALYSMDVIVPINTDYEGWEYNVFYGLMNYDTFFNLNKA
jgi:peptide/nickel transport system substrate-binding protein